MKNEIKWAWQRVFRGYDDRLFWAMDEYLDPIIIAGLKNLRENGHGTPYGLTLKKWNTILDKMIEGFSTEDDDLTLPAKAYKKQQEALVLFAFYYHSLWD